MNGSLPHFALFFSKNAMLYRVEGSKKLKHKISIEKTEELCKDNIAFLNEKRKLETEEYVKICKTTLSEAE